MVRKLLPLLALCAALAPGAVIAAGCGAEDAAGVDVAKAASATGAKGTAEIDLDVRVKGFGLPGAMDIEGEGVTALSEPKMDITLDLADVASSFGMPVDDADVRIKVDGADVYVQPPSIPGLELPGGATWAALDLAKALKALGVDTEGFGALFSVDPAAQLRALQEAKGLKEAGEEKIGGVDTTHYKGTVTPEDMIATLSPDAQAAARKLFKKLEGVDETIKDPIPVELWIDDQGVVRRMVQSGKVPGQKGVPGGEMRFSYELSDFGAKLDTSAPPKNDTYQATEPLLRILKEFGGLAAGGLPGSTTD